MSHYPKFEVILRESLNDLAREEAAEKLSAAISQIEEAHDVLVNWGREKPAQLMYELLQHAKRVKEAINGRS